MSEWDGGVAVGSWFVHSFVGSLLRSVSQCTVAQQRRQRQRNNATTTTGNDDDDDDDDDDDERSVFPDTLQLQQEPTAQSKALFANYGVPLTCSNVDY